MQPVVVTLFEHECTGDHEWSTGDLRALERLNRKAGAELLRPVLQGGKVRLRAAQHVGVLRLGKQTIQILPKIYQTESATDRRRRAEQATLNLLHMLRTAADVPIREQGLASLLRRRADWFEVLTHLFAVNLREEWQRGPCRGYVGVEDNLPVLKGKWRIAEQLRRPARDHIFAVAYDEFTADVPINRVFRFVVERLWRLTRDGGNRQMLGELRQWLDEVTLLPALAAADAGPALLTRLNRRLEPLLNLARLFLDGGAMQMTAGDLSSFAFVFDMNRVFEGFVVNFVRKHRGDILPPEWRHCELLPQTRGASRFLAHSQGKPAFRLKPDLAVRQGTRFPLLMDAKYKRLDPAALHRSAAPADFYQMYAYAQRYHCPRVVMIYPQTADMPAGICREFTLKGTGRKTVVTATVDVRPDLGSSQGRVEIAERLRQVLQSRGVQL